jgi:hypothetical protein
VFEVEPRMQSAGMARVAVAGGSIRTRRGKLVAEHDSMSAVVASRSSMKPPATLTDSARKTPGPIGCPDTLPASNHATPQLPSPRNPARASMQIRSLHAYVGTFIAPSVLFFAMTGLLQIYNLHEAHPGYTPPSFVEKLAAVHKDQRLATPHGPSAGERPPPNGSAFAQHDHDESHGHEPRQHDGATSLLKAFFALVAIGLIFSTGSGIWMALQHARRKRVYLVLLLTGTLVPALLAALTV